MFKPRNQHLNNLLRTKRSTAHDLKNKKAKRAVQKRAFRKQLQDL